MVITKVKSLYAAVTGLALVYIFMPLVSLAQATGTVDPTGPALDNAESGLINRLVDFINNVIPFLIAIGVLFIIIGLIMYITARDEGATGKAIKVFVGGIIATVAILAIWFLISVFASTLGFQTGGGLNNNAVPDAPGIPTGN